MTEGSEMRKRRQWQLIIVDEDSRQYAATGPLTDDTDWNRRICEEQNKSRNIRCFSHDITDSANLMEWARESGLTQTDVNTIMAPPADRSCEYTGRLPKYANGSDRTRLVKILCRGPCGSTRLAQLNTQYPGQAALRKGPRGVYEARCLMCGYKATDNYNWFR